MKNHNLFYQACFTFLMILTYTVVKSQPQVVMGNLVVVPPYSLNYSDYIHFQNNVVGDFTNTSTSSLNVYFLVTFKGLHHAVSMDNNFKPANGFDLIPGITQMYAVASTINGYILDLQTQLQYNNISYNDVVTNQPIPADDYKLCISIRDFNTGNELGNICSQIFRIQYYDPPIINTPDNGHSYSQPSPLEVNISWNLRQVPPAGVTKYTLELLEIPQNSTLPPEELFNYNAGSIRSFPSILNTSFIINNTSQINIEVGKTYAFRVIASNDQAQFNNNGVSAVNTFSFGNSINDYTVVAAYPSDGETVPFDFFPNVVCFKPYSNNYRKFEWSYELRNVGGRIATRSDNDIWPHGPQITEAYFVSPALSVYRSQLLPISLSTTGWTAQHVQLIRGQRYTWHAQTSMLGEHNTLIAQRDIDASFVYGMGRPQLLEPAYGASFPPGSTIHLKFNTSNAPVPLIPPPVVQADNQSMNLFAGSAHERWILEIARTIDFHDIVYTISGKIDAGYDGLGTDNEQTIKEALYKDIPATFYPNANGYYYWRVKWCNNPGIETDTTSYITSIIWPFWVGEAHPVDNGTTGSHSSTNEGPCTSSCLVAATTNRTASSNLNVDKELVIGKFKLKVKQFTISGSDQFSGKGEIKISNISSALIKVKFDHIQFNNGDTIFAGAVSATNDNDELPHWYTNYVQNNVGSIPDISDNDAELVKQTILNGNRFINLITGNAVGLPVGWDFSTGGTAIIMGITKMEFTPTIAKMDVIMHFKSPKFLKELIFGLADQCFTPDGLGDSGKVILSTDIVTSMENGLGIRLKAPSSSTDFGTYISYNCDGINCISLEAELLFPQDKFLKDNPDGSTSPDQVKGTFAVRFCDVDSGWIARINMDPFQVKGHPGWGFVAREIWFDFSDAINPAGMQFPASYDYDDGFTPPVHPGDANYARLINTWHGIYIKSLELRLPTFYGRFSTAERPKLDGQDWIIDHTGLSGKIGVTNFIPLTDGNFEKWSASVDSIYLTFASGDVTEFKWTGHIRLPVMDSADSLKYRMVEGVDPETEETTFLISVSAVDVIHVPLLAARLSLAPDSHINLTLASQQKKVHIEAVLNGNFALNRELDAIAHSLPNTAFDSIKFQGLTIDNFNTPWFREGTWSLASPAKKIGGFNFGLSDVHILSTTEGTVFKAGLQFTGNLDILGNGSSSSATGINASTTLSLWGRVNIPGNMAPHAEFDHVQLDSVSVTGNLSVITVHGAIGFYHNNATFGNGFKGLIAASILDAVEISAAAQFGEVNHFKYWYVDVNAQSTMAPIIPLGAVGIFGVGGGAYHKMRPVSVDRTHPKLPENEIGGSMSQYTYVPDNAQSWGFLATTFIGTTANRNVFNADATFQMTFAEAGGISEINFGGTGRFMSAPDDKSNSSVTATLDIKYTVASKILDGKLTVSINVAEGVVKGAGENGLAGEASFHVEPGSWQILIGTPNTPISLEILKLATSASYLMIGDNLPPFNPPPATVTDILGSISSPDLGNGDGFAFGVRNHFDTQKMYFLIFYAQFLADMGFDIALKNYNITCAGSHDQIGINGWYANAAVWAYFMGEVGLHVDVWFFEGDVDIVRIAAAAYLGGGLPNPLWMEGRVGGDYDILGGLISGHCNFKVTFGEKCQMDGAGITGVKVITDIQPADGSSRVSVFVSPLVTYSVAIGREIPYKEIDNEGNEKIRTFKCIQDVFELRKEDNTLIAVQQSIDADKMGALLNLNSCLDGPDKTYKIKVIVHWEEYINGAWVRVTTAGASETKEVSFTTSARPTDIPKQQVKFTYPLDGAQFYLQNECKKGGIFLNSGMSYLFENTTNATYTFEARFTPVDGSGSVLTTTAEYYTKSYPTGKILFAMPSLMNSKIYSVQLIKKRQNSSSSSKINMLNKSYHFGENNNININQRQIPGTYSANSNELQLYQFYFKTSKFNTLAEKLAQTQAIFRGYNNIIFAEVLRFDLNSSESFDVYDIAGYKNGSNVIVEPLVKIGADWTSQWPKNVIDEYIYSTNSLAKHEWSPPGFTPLPRETNAGSIGFPPAYAIDIFGSGGYINPLSESQVHNTAFPPATSSTGGSLSSAKGSYLSSNAASATAANTNTSNVELIYSCAAYTLIDYINLKPKLSRLIGEFSSATLNSKISHVLSSSFTPALIHATYGLHSWYMPPIALNECPQWHYGKYLDFTY